MGTPRFTPEFKQEAVRQVVDRGYPSPKFLLVWACRLTAFING